MGHVIGAKHNHVDVDTKDIYTIYMKFRNLLQNSTYVD